MLWFTEMKENNDSLPIFIFLILPPKRSFYNIFLSFEKICKNLVNQEDFQKLKLTSLRSEQETKMQISKASFLVI